MQNYLLRFDGMMDSLKSLIRAYLEPAKSFFEIFGNFWTGAALTFFVFAALLCFCAARGGKTYTNEIKKTHTLAFCSMLIAINVISEIFAQDLTPYIRISFGFVTVPVAAMLFGPYAACMVGILQDVAGFLIHPAGAFILPLTINEGIMGIIMGLMLYERKVTVVRVLAAEIIVSLFVSIILNSVSLAPTVGSGFVGILPSRIVKNIIMVPIQTAVVYTVLKVIKLRIKR